MVVPSEENYLTAAVFLGLAYLPSSALWQILCGARQAGDPLPCDPGPLEGVQFWPSVWARPASAEPMWTVPDVLLRFNRVALIVEVKLSDSPAQSADQWAKEWAAYHHTQGGVEPSTVILFALGGLGNQPGTTVEQLRSQANASLLRYQGSLPPISVAAASWSSLAQAVKNSEETSCDGLKRLLGDLLEVFDYFNIQWRKPGYLCELPQWASRYATRDQSTTTLRQWAPLAPPPRPADWLDRVAAFRPITSSSITTLMRLHHAP